MRLGNQGVNAMADEPKKQLSPAAKYGIGVLLTILLAVLASQYGIKPEPLPVLPATTEAK